MELKHCAGLLAFCSLLPAGIVRGQTGRDRPDYRNPASHGQARGGPPRAMTLEEKVRKCCAWSGKRPITDGQGRFEPAHASEWFKAGIGRIERPSDGHGARARRSSPTRSSGG